MPYDITIPIDDDFEIRELRAEDVDAFVELENSTDAKNGWEAMNYTPEQVAAAIRERLQSGVVYLNSLVVSEGGTFVGRCGIRRFGSADYEIDCFLWPQENQRRGIGRRVFEALAGYVCDSLGRDRVFATVKHPDVLRLLTGMGFAPIDPQPRDGTVLMRTCTTNPVGESIAPG